jgi:hypothetical protein
VALNVGPGDAVDCTFTKTKRGHMPVDLVADPAIDPQVFDLILTGGPAHLSDTFALGDASPPYDGEAFASRP